MIWDYIQMLTDSACSSVQLLQQPSSAFLPVIDRITCYFAKIAAGRKTA